MTDDYNSMLLVYMQHFDFYLAMVKLSFQYSDFITYFHKNQHKEERPSLPSCFAHVTGKQVPIVLMIGFAAAS